MVQPQCTMNLQISHWSIQPIVDFSVIKYFLVGCDSCEPDMWDLNILMDAEKLERNVLIIMFYALWLCLDKKLWREEIVTISVNKFKVHFPHSFFCLYKWLQKPLIRICHSLKEQNLVLNWYVVYAIVSLLPIHESSS